MPNTDGYYSADTPINDMEICLGASELTEVSGFPANSKPNIVGGWFCNQTSPAHGFNIAANVQAALKRTGFRPTAALAQQQFGSAALSNSNPDGTVGFPPFQGQNLVTLKGGIVGPIPKGIMVNSADVIYNSALSGNAFVSLNFGLFNTVFVDGVAPAVTALIPLAQYGLQLAWSANGTWRINIPNPNPSFLVTSGSSLIANISGNSPASAQGLIYGVVLKCSYNFN